MVSSVYMPSSGIDESYGSFIPFFFLFLKRNLHVAVVESLSSLWFFVTPWTAAHQVSLYFTISRVCSNLCPLSQWCYPNISFFPFSSPYSLAVSICFHQQCKIVPFSPRPPQYLLFVDFFFFYGHTDQCDMISLWFAFLQ